MNIEVKSRSSILHVKDDGLRFDYLKRHHIIHREVMMSYLCRHYKVALVDIFWRVNVIVLWIRYGNLIDFLIPSIQLKFESRKSWKYVACALGLGGFLKFNFIDSLHCALYEVMIML